MQRSLYRGPIKYFPIKFIPIKYLHPCIIFLKRLPGFLRLYTHTVSAYSLMSQNNIIESIEVTAHPH